MKSKIKRGKDFNGLCRYILRKSAQAELIGGNLAGITAAELAKEFQRVANLRPGIEKPVWHGSLALPKGDFLENDKWNQVVNEYLQGLGFDLKTTPFVVVRHQNTQSDHVHIAASRVNLSGNLYLGKNEHLIATRLCQNLELRHGLTVTLGPDSKAPAKALKTQEKAMQQRTGKVPPRRQLQLSIDKILKDNSSLTVDEFIKKLAQAGISAKPNLSKSGKMSGFGFEINNIAFKASQLGKRYGWQTLEKRLQQPQQQVKVTPAPEAPKPVFVSISDKADRVQIAVNYKEIKRLSSEIWQAKRRAKRRQGIISRIINWRRKQVLSKEIERLRLINAALRAKAEARIMAPAAPTTKVQYDQIVGDFCRLQVSKDKALPQLNANQKAYELALQQTSSKVLTLQNRKSELLAAGKKQGWGPNTPPPPIWQPLQRKAHVVWVSEFNNISIELSKLQTLEIQQKQTVEQAKTAARDRTQDVWSQARREVEARPQMTDFIKQNKLIKSKKQIKQRGSQGLSL